MMAGHWVEDGQTSTAQDQKLSPNQNQPLAAVLSAQDRKLLPNQNQPPAAVLAAPTCLPFSGFLSQETLVTRGHTAQSCSYTQNLRSLTDALVA